MICNARFWTLAFNIDSLICCQSPSPQDMFVYLEYLNINISYLFQVFLVGINVPKVRLYFHFEIKTTCRHSNVPFIIIEMTMQSAVILAEEQPLVVVMICTSVTMPTQTTVHTPTLVIHTNLQKDTNISPHKPKHYWRASTNSHQLRLRFFAVRRSNLKLNGNCNSKSCKIIIKVTST